MSELPIGELSRLNRLIKAHTDRFALALIRAPRLAERYLLSDAVRVLADQLHRPLRRIDGSGLQPVKLWERLVEPVDLGTVILLDGLDEAFRAENGEVLSILSRQRERLAHALKGPTLLLLGDSALDRFLASAPDLADWHAATFDFRVEGDVTTAKPPDFDTSPGLTRDLMDTRVALLKGQLEQTVSDRVRHRICNEIGQISSTQGEYAQACDFFSLALEAASRHYGENHSVVSECQEWLAYALADHGKFHEARTLTEAILHATIRVLGTDPSRVASLRAQLAGVLCHIGDYEEARKQIEVSLDSGLRQFGAESRQVAARRSTLATVLWRSGDREGAKRQFEIALELALRTCGVDSPEVAIRRSNLAYMLVGLGEYSSAREQAELALESDLRRAGENHPAVAIRRVVLAQACVGLGDLDQASRQLVIALDVLRAHLPANHPYVEEAARTLEDLQASARTKEPDSPTSGAIP